MRVAVVSPFLDRQHGTERCVIEQIERLARKDGWTIDLYSQGVSQLNGVRSAPDVLGGASGSIVWHKVPAIPGPQLVRYLWWFYANQWQRRRDQRLGKVPPDLVYSPGINCPDADVIVVHIVFHAFYERIHGELILQHAPIQKWPLLIHRKLYYKLIMTLEQKIYRNPDVRLIAVSSLVARQLNSHFQREDVTVIPNAVDALRFTPEARIAKRGAARQKLSYAETDFVLLLIGNDWKKKGLDTLLRALSVLRDLPLRLLVVGSDDPVLYRQMLNQLRLGDLVHFERPISDVTSFYAAADLYVGPSLEDAFNLPILEAMACGVPVIASTEAGASENVRDRETGLLLPDPQHADQLARLIRLIFENPELRLKMSECASRYAHANCTWDKNAERTRQFLEEALNMRRFPNLQSGPAK